MFNRTKWLSEASHYVLDGEGAGHPFRGNAYVTASRQSSAAGSSSRMAKRAEKAGDHRALKKAHKTAYHAHMAAMGDAKGKTLKYHRTMAKFHGQQAGATLDSVALDRASPEPKADTEPVMVNKFESGDKVVSLDDNTDHTVTGQRGAMVSVKGNPKAINANRLKLASGKKCERVALDDAGDALDAVGDQQEVAKLRGELVAAGGALAKLAIAKQILTDRQAYAATVPAAPTFASYAEAQAWIARGSKQAGSKSAFYATAQYKAAFPAIQSLFKAEQADDASDAMALMAEAGIAVGDRVEQVRGSLIDGVSRYAGTVFLRGGIPMVRMDGKATVSRGGRLSESSQVPWEPAWRKAGTDTNPLLQRLQVELDAKRAAEEKAAEQRRQAGDEEMRAFAERTKESHDRAIAEDGHKPMVAEDVSNGDLIMSHMDGERATFTAWKDENGNVYSLDAENADLARSGGDWQGETTAYPGDTSGSEGAFTFKPAADHQVAAAVAAPDVDGFGASMGDLERGAAEAALLQQQKFNGQGMSRRDFIRQAVAEGATVATNQADGRRINFVSGSFMTQADIGKTAMDYAEFLIGKKGGAATPAGESSADLNNTEAVVAGKLRKIAAEVEAQGTNNGSRSLDSRWAESAIKRLLGGDLVGVNLSGSQYGALATAKIDLKKDRVGVDDLRRIADKLAAAGNTTAPAPKPEPQPDQTPPANPQRDTDLAVLRQIATGTHPDMLTPELADLIEAALMRFPGDAEVEALADQAAIAYSNGLMAATA